MIKTQCLHTQGQQAELWDARFTVHTWSSAALAFASSGESFFFCSVLCKEYARCNFILLLVFGQSPLNITLLKCELHVQETNTKGVQGAHHPLQEPEVAHLYLHLSDARLASSWLPQACCCLRNGSAQTLIGWHNLRPVKGKGARREAQAETPKEF